MQQRFSDTLRSRPVVIQKVGGFFFHTIGQPASQPAGQPARHSDTPAESSFDPNSTSFQECSDAKKKTNKKTKKNRYGRRFSFVFTRITVTPAVAERRSGGTGRKELSRVLQRNRKASFFSFFFWILFLLFPAHFPGRSVARDKTKQDYRADRHGRLIKAAGSFIPHGPPRWGRRHPLEGSIRRTRCSPECAGWRSRTCSIPRIGLAGGRKYAQAMEKRNVEGNVESQKKKTNSITRLAVILRSFRISFESEWSAFETRDAIGDPRTETKPEPNINRPVSSASLSRSFCDAENDVRYLR